MMTEQLNPSAEAFRLPTADSFRDIIRLSLKARAAREELKRCAAEEEMRHQKELFLTDKLAPDFIQQVMQRVRAASFNGKRKVMLGSFPAAWCTDGGRKINQPEDDWPGTLQGFAREFYLFWECELKPRGFRLEAEIISFPDGMLGDVGAYLSWS